MNCGILLTATHNLLKRIRLTYALAAFFVIFSACDLGSETITMRTWYPSPYGSYQRVKITELLAAGTTTMPLAINGNVVQNGNFTLTPQKCSEIANPATGQLCVDKNDGNVPKVYRNSAWQTMGTGDSLIGNPVVNYHRFVPSSTTWTSSFNIPDGADYALLSIGGIRVCPGGSSDEDSYWGNMYVNLKTKKISGSFALNGALDDRYNFTWIWNNANFNAGMTDVSGDKVNVYYDDVLKINRSGDNLYITVPQMTFLNIPQDFTFFAKFYRRGV